MRRFASYPKGIKAAAAAFALVGLVAFAGTAGRLTSANAASPQVAAIGKTAPGFKLAGVTDNHQVSLDNVLTKHKAAVIMFISVHCPISNAYNNRMVALASKYQAAGVDFIGIYPNVTESVSDCAAHAKANHFNFTVVKDPNCTVADSYDAHHTPTVYVVNSRGILVYEGRIDDNMDTSQVTSRDLAAALDNVLAGKTVANPVTKAFGCSIKRSMS